MNGILAFSPGSDLVPLHLADKPVLLAPMAGVNDPVFRAICRRKGAALTYSEMISAKGLAYGNKKTFEMLGSLPEDRPFAVQLFGNEPDTMASQAQWLSTHLGSKLALIDINMGCPVRKVAGQGSGAALLSTPKLAEAITSAVCSASPVPVTVKIRLLSAADDASTVAFARMLASAGAAALTIHGRTPQQHYTGTAQRDIVNSLVSALDIPVFASGDVYTPDDIQDYRARGAQAVMVARGARGNPWIFSGEKPSQEEVVRVAREHTLGLHAWDAHKLVWMRKHLAWYFKGYPGAVSVRKAVQTAVTLDDYLAILDACE